jgi:hypothetical protein
LRSLLLMMLLALAACGGQPSSELILTPAVGDPTGSLGANLGTEVDTTYPFNAASSPPGPKNTFFRDETFGTPILRVTDWSDGDGCSVGYSYWPTFNRNNTMMLFLCGGKPWIAYFDPDNFRILGEKQSAIPSYEPYAYDDMTWSSVENHVIYSHRDVTINSYNVITGELRTVADFTGYFEGQYIEQMSKTPDDDIFAFSRRSHSTGKLMGFVVYSRTRGVLYNGCLDWDSENQKCLFDEVRVDKTGNYLVVHMGNSNPGELGQVIWDIKNWTGQRIYNGPESKPEGHYDVGSGFLVGIEGSYQPAVQRRSLSDPQSVFYPLSRTGGWKMAAHVSMLAENERWALVSTFGMKGDSQYVEGPLQNEIFQVSTDGNYNVRRIARHHSYVDDYWPMPKANISLDGQFVAYTSNWGGHMDVYVARIPPAP